MSRYETRRYEVIHMGKRTLATILSIATLAGVTLAADKAQAQEGPEEALHGYYVPVAMHEVSGTVQPQLSTRLPVEYPPQELLNKGVVQETSVDNQSHVYYVPAAAHSTGAFNSFWKTLLQGRNPAPLGGAPVTFEILVHPRGAPAQPTDPRMDPYRLLPQAPFDFHDILGMVPYTGAAWLEIRSDGQLDLETSSTYNASPNGEQQGSGYPVFNKATLWTDQRFAHRGDKVRFRLLGNESNTRENYIIFVPPESGPVRVTADLYDRRGGFKGSNNLDVQPGTYTQVSTLGMLYGDPNKADPGDTFVVTTDRLGGGDGDVLAYHIVSRVQTLNPQYQDSTTLEGTIERLVTSASFTTTPENGEVNDVFYRHVNVAVQEDAEITEAHIDVDSDGTYEVHYTGLSGNTFTLNDTFTPLVPYSLNPTLELFILKNGTYYQRLIKGNPYNATVEQNGYIANYNDAKAFIMGNLDLAAKWTSYGTIDGQVYSPNQWRTWWQELFDGNPANQELDYLQFDDAIAIFPVGNVLKIAYTDGTATYMGGFPEQTFDQFRRVVKAAKP